MAPSLLRLRHLGPALLVLLSISGCGGKGDGDDGGDDVTDADGDRYGADEDCDDLDPNSFPGAPELCDQVDNDCDGQVDEDAAGGTTWYQDIDGDGHGTTNETTFACTQPLGYAAVADDCDDREPAAYPGNIESCDEIDNDCDEEVDEAVLRGLFLDDDGDGYGDPDITQDGCFEQDGWVFTGGDCNDQDAAISPAAAEVCNDVDDDCNGVIDDDAVDASSLAEDNDGDGFGAPGTSATSCEGAANELDCDDTDRDEPAVADVLTGLPTGDGSLTAPFDTIQAAIDAAEQCVVVLPGTYYESVDFGGKAITLRSTDGKDQTVIDATGLAGPALRFDDAETAASSVSGFTLSGGAGDLEETSESTACSSSSTCTDYFSTWCGGGLYVEGADPTIDDLIIRDNTLVEAAYLSSGNDEYFTYSYGGGACFVDSYATVRGVRIVNNFADQGGGVYVDESSTVVFDQVDILDNAATDGGGLLLDGGATIATNLLVAWNTASDEGGNLLLLDSVASITNATFAMGTAVEGAGVYAAGSSTLRLINSIVSANSPQGIMADSSAYLIAEHNNVHGSVVNYAGLPDLTGFDGNMNKDPRFVNVTGNDDWTDDDFHLSSTSPCIDAGDPDATMLDVDGTTNDMGAYGGPGGSW